MHLKHPKQWQDFQFRYFRQTDFRILHYVVEEAVRRSMLLLHRK
jgi:hypothetical protein